MIIKVKFIFIFHFACPACFVIYFLHPTLPPYTFCTQQLRSCGLAESQVHMFHFHFSCSACSVIYILHPTLPSYTFCTQQLRSRPLVIYILHPTIPSYTYKFLNVNLEFWNFDFVYDNKGEIYFNFSFFMSSLFCDILFAPNTSAIYILHPTSINNYLNFIQYYFKCNFEILEF